MTPTLPTNLHSLLSQTPSNPQNLPAGRPRWGLPGMLYHTVIPRHLRTFFSEKSSFLAILIWNPFGFFHTSIKQVHMDLVSAPQPHCTTLSLHWVHLLSPPIGVHLLSPPSAPPQGCTTTTTEGAILGLTATTVILGLTATTVILGLTATCDIMQHTAWPYAI